MNKNDLTIVIGFAAILVTALVLYSNYLQQPSELAGIGIGRKAPEIKAAGWVNGPAPTPDELQGKLIVVEAWATWCLPCRIKAPEFVQIYKQFKDANVVFIGLTAEGEEYLPEIKTFLEETNITWRNGYGADQTLMELEAEYIPSTWVIDQDGTICWNHDSAEPLAEFLAKKLEQQ